VAFAKAKAKGMVLTARDLSLLEQVQKEIEDSYRDTKVLVHKMDVTSESDVNAAFAKAVEVFGGVDVAIHNAGMNLDFTPLAQTDTSTWWTQYVSANTEIPGQ